VIFVSVSVYPYLYLLSCVFFVFLLSLLLLGFISSLPHSLGTKGYVVVVVVVVIVVVV
jgi:hypothetical protein